MIGFWVLTSPIFVGPPTMILKVFHYGVFCGSQMQCSTENQNCSRYMLPCHRSWKRSSLGFKLLIVNFLFIVIFAVTNWIMSVCCVRKYTIASQWIFVIFLVSPVIEFFVEIGIAILFRVVCMRNILHLVMNIGKVIWFSCKLFQK